MNLYISGANIFLASNTTLYTPNTYLLNNYFLYLSKCAIEIKQ